jgi:L,D-transpeptidase catalytic domain/Sel1 repeat
MRINSSHSFIIVLVLIHLASCADPQVSQVPATKPVAVMSVESVSVQPKTDSKPSRLVISVHDQRMTLLKGSTPVAQYLVSTAKNGVGEAVDSGRTPRGRHAITEKIGAGVAIGTVFKDRLPTGEIVAINALGRSPIVTRILRLRGLEGRNQTSLQRYIYLHGTPAENSLGTPASEGNIRMRSEEIVDLFERVDEGTEVTVFEEPMVAALAMLAESDMKFADLHKSAKAGVPGAFGQLCVGHMYGERGLNMDNASALAWCSRAADMDDPNGVTLLGELHEQGRGAAVDLAMARQFYERAAKLGHPHAQWKAAQMYKAGVGGVADPILAAQYLELSVKQGYERAVKQATVKAQ